MHSLEDLYPVFYPKSVAVIGASNQFRKSGYFCMESIISMGKFKGKIFPINPSSSDIFGLKAYPSISDVPDQVDLAIVTVPATVVPATIEECGKNKVKGAVIITAGFKEAEVETGRKLQDELVQAAKKYNVKIIGPNTFGAVNPLSDLNASFSPILTDLMKGDIAFISQSGGMSHNFAYTAMDDKIGMSKVMSLGNRCNVSFVDLLNFVEQEEETKVIAMYIEGVENPRAILEAAKRITPRKPIVALKGGTEEGMEEVTCSHTGTLAGKIEIYNGMFKQAGMIVAENSVAFYDIAKAFSIAKPPKGDRFAVASPIAGPGIVMTDTLKKHGMIMATFSDSTIAELQELMPPFTHRYNPVDMPFIQDVKGVEKVINCILADENVDFMGYVICQQEMFNPLGSQFAQIIIEASARHNKPVAVAFISQLERYAAERIMLQRNSIPIYTSAERAGRALAALGEYGKKFS